MCERQMLELDWIYYLAGNSEADVFWLRKQHAGFFPQRGGSGSGLGFGLGQELS
jgi:hypothetical protein